MLERTSAAPRLPRYLRNPHNPASASHINQLKWYPSNRSQYVSKQHHFSSMQETISEQQTSYTQRNIFLLNVSSLFSLSWSPTNSLMALLSQHTYTHTNTVTGTHTHTHTHPACFLSVVTLLWPCPFSLYHLNFLMMKTSQLQRSLTIQSSTLCVNFVCVCA